MLADPAQVSDQLVKIGVVAIGQAEVGAAVPLGPTGGGPTDNRLGQAIRELSSKVDRDYLWTLGIIITMGTTGSWGEYREVAE